MYSQFMRLAADRRRNPQWNFSFCYGMIEGIIKEWRSAMNEKHMQYVLTVLKEGSFTGAAKKLYVSQPSLSQIIKMCIRDSL